MTKEEEGGKGLARLEKKKKKQLLKQMSVLCFIRWRTGHAFNSLTDGGRLFINRI